ncbi:MAG: ComEA family DNA-binding protein [Natronosporangium sp.]
MKITRWAAVAALGVAAGAVALAGPAQAQDGHFPDAGWQVRDFNVGWVPAAESAIVNATTVELTKPAGDIGTSMETTNLGLPVMAGDEISVTVEKLGGATADAGAVRLFYYDHPDADTNGAAPTAFAADDGSGGISVTVAADGTVGTLGMTYDASNASAGTVQFSDLTVGETLVLFHAPSDPDPDPTKPADPPAGPECVDVNTATVDELKMLKHIDDDRAAQILNLRPFSSVDDLDRVDGLKAGGPRLAELVAGGDGFPPLCDIVAVPGGGGGGGGDDDKPGLPVTGTPALLIGAGGAGLLALGGGAYLLARKRRVSFTA